MKRILTSLAVLAALISTAFTAPAQTVKKDFDLQGFTGIELGNEFKATVGKSDKFSVSIELSENLLPYLDVRTSNGVLIVGLRNVPTKLTILRNNVMNVDITMPELRSVTMNGTSKLTVNDSFDLGNSDFSLSSGGACEVKQMEIHARNATLSVSGTSRINLNGDFVTVNVKSSGTSRVDLKADAEEFNVNSTGTAVTEADGTFDTMIFDLSGTSNVTLRGKADEMKVVASSAGSVDALRMPVNTATVQLSGAGVCKAYVNEALEVQCTGVSTCSYKSDGDIKLDVKEITRTATLKKL